MKTSKLKNLAWAIFALALATTTAFAQGRGNGNRCYNTQNLVCLEQISDLTDDQKTKFQELVNTHQKDMAELREQRRSTTDEIEKNEIRGTMLKNVKAHRESLKSLLTVEQQQEFDTFQLGGNNCWNQQGKGNFKGRGQGQNRQQWAGNNGCGSHCYRGCSGKGLGNGNRQLNRSCNRNYIQNN